MSDEKKHKIKGIIYRSAQLSIIILFFSCMIGIAIAMFAPRYSLVALPPVFLCITCVEIIGSPLDFVNGANFGTAGGEFLNKIEDAIEYIAITYFGWRPWI